MLNLGAISNFYIFTIIMKKLFLVFIAVFSFIAQASAQSSVMATLHHDGDIKTFYGTTALRRAHEEAAHGDIITLSSGAFVSTDITKAITLRGAGMGLDSISGTEPTMINGDFKITMPNDSTMNGNTLTMEGIFHDGDICYMNYLNNPQFIKCNLNKIYQANTYSIHNATFIHCLIRETLDIENGSASLFNCYVNDPWLNYTTSASYEFQNCVIRSDKLDKIRNSLFRNCFIYSLASGGNYFNYISAFSSAFNCVGFKTSGTIKMFVNMRNSSNKEVSSVSEVFKTWTGEKLGATSLRTEKLELKDDAKTKYLGNDRTQIGIYGGSIPFVASPSNPQITKLNVASKSTADGKLSVDIEVKAAE